MTYFYLPQYMQIAFDTKVAVPTPPALSMFIVNSLFPAYICPKLDRISSEHL